MARHLARLAADAHGCVGEETYWLGHGALRELSKEIRLHPREMHFPALSHYAASSFVNTLRGTQRHFTLRNTSLLLRGFRHIAHKHLRLMNRHIRVRDERRQIV